MTQLSLFDDRPLRRARTTDPLTSSHGAADVRLRAGTQKAKLLAVFGDGSELNAYEAACRVPGMVESGTCYWKRISELEREHEAIETTGEFRMGGNGSLRQVYRLTDRGWRMLRRLNAESVTG